MASSFNKFPWQGKTDWDVDVAVVGGGPAGLAAALRLRWLKTFPLVPVSVALVNSGPLGGLAKLGKSILTGPSLAFPAGSLVERLEQDLAKWPLPMIGERVLAIDRDGEVLTLTLEGGSTLRALSVIMASGMLDLRNLWRYWKKGVSATYGSRQHMFELLSRELAKSTAPVVAGGPLLLHMAQHLRTMQPRTTILVLDPAMGKSEEIKDELPVVYGSSIAARQGNNTFSGLEVETREGSRFLAADRLIIDFNSLEHRNTNLISGLPRRADGFIAAGADGATDLPGLFAAGDCTGPPFSAVVALGQGVTAGFAAYRYVFVKKYGSEPPLFAYYGDAGVALGPEAVDFTIGPDLMPDRLVEQMEKDEKDIWPLINGSLTIKEISAKSGQSPATVEAVIRELLQARAITFLPKQRD